MPCAPSCAPARPSSSTGRGSSPSNWPASSGDVLYVRAPEHIRSWVGERYLPLVRDAAAAVVGAGASVEIVEPRLGARRGAPG